MAEVIVGIDLGTTNSEVAALVEGNIDVLAADGEQIMPSVVGVSPEGALLVGTPARNQYVVYPERTVKSIKRLMGTEQRVALGEQMYAPPEISAMILRALKTRAEAARRAPTRKKDKDVKVAQASKSANLDAAEVRTPPAGDQDAQKLFDQGTSLYRKGQFTDAANTLNQCLRVDPSFAKCHMVLGSTYAKLREPELGAQHYRRFVQLAPNDPEAPKVKLLLDQYETRKSSNE